MVPISDNVINAVHLRAKNENMPKSLKIQTEQQPLYSIRFAEEE